MKKLEMLSWIVGLLGFALVVTGVALLAPPWGASSRVFCCWPMHGWQTKQRRPCLQNLRKSDVFCRFNW